MKIPFFLAAATSLVLGACAETASTPGASTDPITAAIVGKTLVADVGGGARFYSAPDGTTTGMVGDEEYVGTWAVRDGKMCNQYSKPERFSSPACLDATLNGDGTITIATRNGNSVVWTIED